MNRKKTRWILWILYSTAMLAVVVLLSLGVGSSGLSVKEIASSVVVGRGSTGYSILFDIRLPRIILGFAVGGALSIAGVIMQGMFRNSLVEPYTLGISGGAAIGVCLNIVSGLDRSAGVLSLPASGVLGAMLVLLLVYSLSIKKGMLQIQQLLLTGVMISFISSSLIMVIMAVSRAENLHGIVFWIMGSLEEPNWLLIKAASVISVSGLAISYFFCHDLNALALGEDEAHHLGIRVERSKKLLFILASMLTGLCVSVSGIIGFVGLVVPHIVRLFAGNDHRILLIGSFLCGSAFLIACDTLARTVIAPVELPVGVITGIIGGIIFIYVLSKKRTSLK